MLQLDSFHFFDSLNIAVIVLLLLGSVSVLSKGTYWGKEAVVLDATLADGNDGSSTNESDDERSIVDKMRSSNKNCVVFFGSETGSAEDFASRLAKEGSARFSLRTIVADLEDFDYRDLDHFPKDHVAIFALASYGDGEPTNNAVNFYEYINRAADDVLISQSEDLPLSNLNYVIFGLGNSTYENYNSVVRRVDASLKRLGAQRVGPVGEGDDGAGTLEEDFLGWKDSIWAALVQKMRLKELESSSDVYLGEPNVQHLKGFEGVYDFRNPYIAPIVESHEIFKMRDRNCIHMELDISESGLSYQTGDHVAVWPTNSSTEVNRFLKVHGLTEKANSVINVRALDPTVKVPFPTPTTYDAIIRYYIEICSVVSRQFVSALAPFAPDEGAKNEMTKLGSDKEYFSETVTKNYLNIAMLLELVGCGKEWKDIPFSIYIEGLHRLQPRYYSISSSSLVQKNQISITAVVESLKFTGRREAWKGVATNYLLEINKRQSGELDSAEVSYDIAGPRRKYDGIRIPLHIRRSNFKLPSDPSKPIILIGPGSGVAPFRGFVQERAAQAKTGQEVGKIVLFNGCRSRDQDFIYADDWVIFKEMLGDKFELILGTSREERRKVYVQHRLREHAQEVNELLLQSAYFYVCGDAANMAREVSTTVVQILIKQRGLTQKKAEEVVRQMRSVRQYQEDTW